MADVRQVAPGNGGDVTRGLIVCADDFAFNTSVSMAIARLAHLGRISATSAMVLAPRWGQDVALLQDLHGRIDVGLHLDWTSEFALTAGHGMSLARAMCRALLGGFDQAQAQAVIGRQLDLFEAHWQAPPDFVDGHQHVQQFAGIREALVAVLQRRYGAQAVKPYLRISRAPPGMANIKSRVIAWMGANALESIAISAYLTKATCLFGIYNLQENQSRFAGLMAHWMACAPADAILMCHPAQVAEPGDEIGPARVQEFAYLASDAFGHALQRAGVAVVRGCDVLAPLKSVRD